MVFSVHASFLSHEGGPHMWEGRYMHRKYHVFSPTQHLWRQSPTCPCPFPSTLYFWVMNHSILKDSHLGAIFLTVTFTFLINLFFFCLKNSFLKLRENGFKIMRETRSFFSFSFIFQFIYIVAYDFLFFFFFLLFIKPIEYPLMNTFSMFVSLIIQLFKEELNWMPNVLLL